MKITEFLEKNMIAVDLQASDKEEALAAMVGHIIDNGGIDAGRRDALVAKLMERESLGSTGVGGEVAIPHASGEDLQKMMVAIGKFPEGVEYKSLDAKPIRLMFMIIGPEREPRAHLQLLAAIVRTLRNKPLLDGIMQAASSEDIYRLLITADRG